MFSRAVACLITHTGFYTEASSKGVVPNYMGKDQVQWQQPGSVTEYTSVGKPSAFPLLLFGNFGKICLSHQKPDWRLSDLSQHSHKPMNFRFTMLRDISHMRKSHRRREWTWLKLRAVTWRQGVSWIHQEMVTLKQSDEDWWLQGATEISVKLLNLCL